jgi:hypothetical protein
MAEGLFMTISGKGHFPRAFAIVLMGMMLFAGCSRLPWSKSKKGEPLPEGKTVYIEDLERSKGVTKPPESRKGPVKPPADEGKTQGPPEAKGHEKEAGEKIALAPVPPADLTFSPVRTLRRKICVVNFEDRTAPQGEKYGELAGLRLLQELENAQRAVLVDKEVVLEAMAREGVEPRDLLDPQAMKEAHRLLGIQAFIAGSISNLQVASSPPVGDSGIKSSMASVRIELRLFDASTSNLLRTFIGKNPSFTAVETGLHSDHRSVLKAIDYGIGQVVDGMLRYLDFLEWSTTVTRVEDGRVYVNAGRLTGLRVGNILEVYEPGQEVINPITNISLGWTTGKQKGKLLVTHLFGVDGSVAEPINGAGFMANDIVKIPTK